MTDPSFDFASRVFAPTLISSTLIVCFGRGGGGRVGDSESRFLPVGRTPGTAIFRIGVDSVGRSLGAAIQLIAFVSTLTAAQGNE